MSYEVVYTSSPNGLKDGDRGFCTIAATAGIPRLLQEKLESLSGYRHAFSVQSHQNPVNYCHRIVRIQGAPFFVLSRIADAGIDYSGRNNKIAHHLALSVADVRSAGTTPSALLADPEFWFSEWNGEPETLPDGRMPSAHPSVRAGCRSWEKAFGDAGWAGVLARAVQDDFETVSVIVPDGRNTLALVSEAMSLVPAQKQWKVCFSTFFTRSTAGSGCHWRFLLDGSEEATALRRDGSPGILVDPLDTQVLAEDDEFVKAARSGEVLAVREPIARDEPGEEETAVPRRPVTRSQVRRRKAAARARRARLAPKVARPVYEEDYELPPSPPPEDPAPSRVWVWWAVAAGVLAVSVVSFLIVWSFD